MQNKQNLENVKFDGMYIKNIPVEEQTEELCIEAVRNNPMALQYIHNQTEDICLEAIKKDGMALQYVKNITHRISIEAIRYDYGSPLEEHIDEIYIYY